MWVKVKTLKEIERANRAKRENPRRCNSIKLFMSTKWYEVGCKS